MRLLNKNKQKMFYSLYIGEQPIYEKDSQGNPIIDYVDEDGNVYYREIETVNAYAVPIVFKASIRSSLSETRVAEYGLNPSNIYSEIACPKGALPLEYGSKIWKKSKIEYLENGFPDVNTSDYTVKGVLDEYKDYDFFLLERNVKNTI